MASVYSGVLLLSWASWLTHIGWRLADGGQGGLGNDRYVFGADFGFDGVLDYDYTAGNSDTFQFTSYNRTDFSFTRVGDALRIERLGSAGADVIFVNDWYQNGSNGAYKIESWEFANGQTFTATDVESWVV
jgi:hypothetical protein